MANSSRELNETQPGQITPSVSQFLRLSEFSPRLVPETANELPRQLVLSLANGLVDRLMGEANDLVVNTASMTAIDPEARQLHQGQARFWRQRGDLSHELFSPAAGR